jgi:predicted nucleic acid-binding protein
MKLVLDTSILIAFSLTDEPLNKHAEQFLNTVIYDGTLLVAPRLLRSEVVATIRKAVYQQRITYLRGHEVLQELLAYPVTFYEDDALLESAYKLAEQFNRPRAYDTQYLALAERLGCDVWTADERLFNAVQGKFPNIYWLGNWTLSP